MEMYFIAEVRGFAGNFAPRGTAYCDGQLMAISQNDALFSLVGTIYGGDGRTTFGLPDLRGRAPIGQGHGAGLTTRQQGSKGGAQTVQLIQSQLPSHTHSTSSVAKATSDQADTSAAGGEVFAVSPDGASWAPGASTSKNKMKNGTANVTINTTGGSQEHNNLSPYLGIRYIIALVGVYPSRS